MSPSGFETYIISGKIDLLSPEVIIRYISDNKIFIDRNLNPQS